MTFAKIYITFRNHLGEKKIKNIVKQNKNDFIRLIDQHYNSIGGSKLLFKILSISKDTYRNWKRMQANYCPVSHSKLCYVKVPNQVSHKEINVLRKYMSYKEYSHWSIAAVWGKAFRNGKTTMGETTWYKYAREEGFSQKRKTPKKPRKKISFRADKVNQTWHADVSHCWTSDNVKFYFYTVVDNFSRKIIEHRASRVLSAEIRTQTIKAGIAKAFDVDLNDQKMDLIVDGGSENNNRTIDAFIKQCHVEINKEIALKTVSFSNAVVEGPYKTMKSGYFRHRLFHPDLFEQEIDWFVNDYNDVRPHSEHKWYTPNEIYDNSDLKGVRPHQRDRKKRLEENRKFCCKSKLQDDKSIR